MTFSHSTSRSNHQSAFTLIEILLALIVVAILSAIAIPSYRSSLARLKNNQAIRDITQIETMIERYNTDNYQFPPDLAALGVPIPKDPWDHPYVYLNITAGAPKGKIRRDRNLNPLNNDYDLYSMGADGVTTTQLTGAKARDDIVRAGNGSFIGLASEH